MSTPALVIDFYRRIWDQGDRSALPQLLCEEFSFRGSLGAELKGHTAFWEYVRGVRGPLAEYRCDILDCVSEGNNAFARMRFSGLHVGEFCGYRPSGLPVHWQGAALFSFENSLIRALWVLGDLQGLDALLKLNSKKPAAT